MKELSRNINQQSVHNSLRQIISGKLKPSDLVNASLERIENRDREIFAWSYLDAQAARDQAKQADKVGTERSGNLPLLGVPIGVKDIIDTKSMPTAYGSPIFQNHVPDRDGAVVEILNNTGAIILGKTHTNEFAAFAPCATRNPHNTKHTPGGSSSGSAAAVADGHCGLSIGSQTAGSTIRPASYCGVWGMKPTFGHISRFGMLNQSPSLDTVGLFARHVEDLVLLSSILKQYDHRDPDMKPFAANVSAQKTEKENYLPPRFAFFKPPFWEELAEPGMSCFEFLLDTINSVCQEINSPLDFEAILQNQRCIQFSDIAYNFGPHYESHPDKVAPEIVSIIKEGRAIRASDYVSAQTSRNRDYQIMETRMKDFDVLIWPSAGGPAPEGMTTAAHPDFCAAWTYFGMPAVNVPLFKIGTLPFGVQLIAKRSDDKRLLQLAKWLYDYVHSISIPNQDDGWSLDTGYDS